MSATPLVDAITFDFWNTICVPDQDRFRDQRIEAIQTLVRDDGIEVSTHDVQQAFAGLLEQFNEKWAANEQFTAVNAAEVVADRLDPNLSSAARAGLVEAFSSAPGLPSLTPNVAAALAVLDAAGVRLGIICDVGMTPSTVLRQYLDQHGVLHHFDHWSFSDEVGVYKPHRAIFEHALSGLGVTADRAAHIGDLRRTDIAGALDMGMLALRYRGAHDDVGDAGELDDLVEGDHIVDDHADLPALLGIAAT